MRKLAALKMAVYLLGASRSKLPKTPIQDELRKLLSGTSESLVGKVSKPVQQDFTLSELLGRVK